MALDTVKLTTFSTTSPINNSIAQGISENAKRQKKVTTTAVVNEEQSAKLEVSSFSKLTANSVDDINLEKVEYIKTAIKNGELSLDVSKIADSLIRELTGSI